MKKSFLFVFIFGLSSCGLTDAVNENCQRSDLDVLCEMAFGRKDREQDEQLKRLIGQVNALSSLLDAQIVLNDENLQLEINALQAEMTELATRQTAVSLIDPCDDHPGHYDEVLMRLEDGRLVAYFEDGGKRFLTVLLPDVQYKTTDAQKCSFRINSNNQIEYH